MTRLDSPMPAPRRRRLVPRTGARDGSILGPTARRTPPPSALLRTAGTPVVWAVVCVLSAALGVPGAAADPTVGQRLLLPFYEVETTNNAGASTLFALRNEAPTPVELTIRYFEPDAPQAPQRTDTVTLNGKQVLPINIRDVANLEVDPDGFARGYVIIEAPEGFTSLHGDYFQVTPDEAFATGYRLLNMDRDLCANLSVRFLEGGAFSGGTQVQLWVDTDTVPLPGGAVVYAIYSEQGGVPLAVDTLVLEVGTTRFPITDLLSGPTAGLTAGVLEISLDGALQGHVSATMSAQNQFSVGLEAACRD